MAYMLSPEILRRYPLFSSMDDVILKEFANAGELCEVDVATWLFREGERAESLYLLLEGEVVIKVPVGTNVLYQIGISRLNQGEILGWSALVKPYEYKLGAMTMTFCKLAKFDGVQLCEIMTHNPHVGYILMSRITQVIGSRLNNLRIRFVSLVEGGRYQQLVGKEPFYFFEGGRSSPQRDG